MHIDADDLIALVRNYNPKTNEALIRKAYAYGERMHEGQVRQSGEPYFTHPVAVAAILTEMKLDDATIVTALLHDTIEDTAVHLQGRQRHLRPRDRRTRRRRHEAHQPPALLARIEAGRELPQALHGDVEGPARHPGQAGRPAPQHAHDQVDARRRSRPRRRARRWTSSPRSPGRMGMQWMREELEDLAFRVLNPEARNSIIRRFITLQRETGDVIQKITADIRLETGKGRHRGRRLRAREEALFDLAQDAGEGPGVLAPVRHLRLPHHHRLRGRLLPRARRDPPALARGAGAVQGLHQPAQVERLPVDPHHRLGPRRQAGRGADPHRARCTRWPRPASPPTGPTATASRVENPFAVDPAKWIATLTERFDTTEDNDEFLEHVKLEMYTDQVFCFTPKGEVVKLPRGRDAARLRLCDPHPDRPLLRRRQGRRHPRAALDAAQERPVGRDHHRRRPAPAGDLDRHRGHGPGQVRDPPVACAKKTEQRFVKLGRELARVAFEHIGKKATDKALRHRRQAAGPRGYRRPPRAARLGRSDRTAR